MNDFCFRHVVGDVANVNHPRRGVGAGRAAVVASFQRVEFGAFSLIVVEAVIRR